MAGGNTARENEYIETSHGARTVRATPSFNFHTGRLRVGEGLCPSFSPKNPPQLREIFLSLFDFWRCLDASCYFPDAFGHGMAK